MKRELEALLFATDAPLTLPRLKAFFPGVTGKALRAAISELTAEYDTQDHAFTVVEFGGGWQIASRPQYATLIEKLFRSKRFARLSRAGLEVLAIIAYRQPITRLQIDEIRGVQSSGALSTLTERSLVTVVGRSETIGHPLLYGTTREFLNHLGLRGLNQLPKLPEIEGLLSDREGLRRFAIQLGEDISESDFDLLADEPASADTGDETLDIDGEVPVEPSAKLEVDQSNEWIGD